MKEKINIGLIFGGPSAEHEISLISAKNIYQAIDKELYNIYLIGVTRQGDWHFCPEPSFLPKKAGQDVPDIKDHGEPLLLKLGKSENNLFKENGAPLKIDVFFPIIHGTCGEDGTLQGVLKLMCKPYVGPNTLGSAVGMDKDIMKRILIQAGIKTAKYTSVVKNDLGHIHYEEIIKQLGTTLFIKPSNSGSSIGVSRVETHEEFNNALNHAFEFDNKLIIEEGINGRELECAVMGNDNPKASQIGEITPTGHAFYSYESKYLDKKGAELKIPAELDEKTKNSIRKIAIDTFKILNCEGLARVDVFLTKDQQIYVNEINTLPGFTSISMYPSLWKASGIEYKNLITELIEYAIKRFNRDKKLKIIQ
ncbi:D-alanine--D-alanine ligase [Candidatus Peregrinibacteria bacterium]|nr:D-alanine--D-alanine ligase [Candidatus Peregrinibacteria bacterium]